MVPPLPTQREFIEYLANLAVDGETALIVRQQLTRRTVELNPNGTVKATWSPMRPEEAIKKARKDHALYGNTGSFIEDRMTDKVSASTANCDYVLCMVLDDIGTKSKEPPLLPTWIMETSEGCFQWGYTFSTQPTKGAFAAAIRAIAEAGFTDSGAINAVRNFRIPGSVNLKPDKGAFKSRLVEFNPDREFTLEEICKALGVEPGVDDTGEYSPVKIKRSKDEVLKWLSDKGMVLTQVNHDGWCGIVCPWADGHSDKTDVGARYNTNDRGFICYHAHCGDKTSLDFLDWVAKNGGPKADHGVDDLTIGTNLGLALTKIPYDPVVLDSANKGLNDVTRKQASRVEKENLFDRFAYITSDDAYFDLLSRKTYPRATFNAIFRHMECRSIHGNNKVQASVHFDENREAKNSPLLHGLTYAPGESNILLKGDELVGNTWRDARPEVDKTAKGDISMWLNHGRTLVPNEKELNHILDVMAFKLQYPNIKINHAVLHAGREGCGKDTFWAPFIWAVCGPDSANRGYMDGHTMSNQWGYHLESEILLINELREPTMADRQALANDLKPVIAAPPEFLDVNRKGLHPYKAVNRTFVLAFSNSRAPISLSMQDRRWYVIWSESPRIDGTEIWKWYKNGGFESIAAWLYQRDVSAFNPAATPEDTEYKASLIEGGMSTSQAFLVHMIKDGVGEFQSGVVGSPFFKLADKLQGQAPAGTKLHHAGISEALQDGGWHNLGQLVSKQYPNRKQVWVSPRIFDRLQNGELTRSEIRNMVESPAPIRLLKKEA